MDDFALESSLDHFRLLSTRLFFTTSFENAFQLIIQYLIKIDRMTFQFKVRPKENLHEECEKEIALLKDYTRAIERENESRNEQRKAMQAEIERLSKLEREWKEKGLLSNSRLSNTFEKQEYSTLKQTYSELKSKYEQLLLDNSSLTTRIINSEVNSSRLVTFENERTRLNEVIKSYEVKFAALESKIISYEREISELKRKQQSSSAFVSQNSSEIAKIESLETQLRAKASQIVRLQREATLKQEQLGGLKRDIASYSSKIDTLSQQLQKLQRSQKVEIRYIQKQDPALRTKMEQINNINGSLSIENNALRIQRANQQEHVKGLERRIAILEETNYALQNQLKSAIEAKQSASRIVQFQEDKSLKEAVYSLKAELQEVRDFNQLVRQQNDELYAQLQIYKSGSRCNRCRHRHQKSKSPIRIPAQQRVVKSKLTEPASTLHSHGTHGHAHHAHIPSNRSQSNLIQTPSYPVYNEPKPRPPVSQVTQSVSDRYNDLQRKIQMLQSQNQSLKQHLVHEI